MDWTPRRPRAKLWPLFVAWLMLVVYCEWISPRKSISRCKWPGTMPESARVALVADPQLVDSHTYPGRPWLFQQFTEWFSDRYLAKNWRFIQNNLDPDATIFLGDLFDGGREWELKPWLIEYERFNTIFPQPVNKKTALSLPGNHDIGFGNTIVRKALDRFKAWFGPTSQVLNIGGHNMILLDTISMSNTEDENIFGPPFQFMRNIADLVEDASKPNFLCTHVPLYRPKDAGCGRYRESERALPYQKGKQYLTQITPELSHQILETVQPLVIFSGDDHDACHVVHNYTVNGIQRQAHEFTVKSMSMAMGIAAPGIQLLTLNPNGGYETSICFQGHPFKPLIYYGVAAIASLVYLFHLNQNWIALLPLAEMKEKKIKTPRFSFKKIGLEILMVMGTYLVSQWYVGRWIYADLDNN